MWTSIFATIRGLGRGERGATAIEYALIAALLSIAIVGGLLALAPDLVGAYSMVGEKLRAAAGG